MPCMLMGKQSKIDWDKIATDAVVALATGGLGKAAEGEKVWAAIARAALQSTVSGAVGSALDSDRHFSWKNVAVSALAAGVTHKVEGFLDSKGIDVDGSSPCSPL